MFDIGWSEMLVIAIVMIVVVGPKDLPKMLRTFGIMTSRLRGMAGDFRKQFDEALKEAELDDVKNLVDDAKKLNPANELRKALNPMQKAADDVRAGLNAAMNPNSAADGKAKSTALGEGKPFDMSKVNAAAKVNMASSQPRPRAEPTEAAASAAIEDADPVAVRAKPASRKSASTGTRKAAAKSTAAKTRTAKPAAAASKPLAAAKRAPAAKQDKADARSADAGKMTATRRAVKTGGTRK